MYTKNQIVNLTIDDIGSEGEGIGHIDGYALFVKDALPGDEIEAKIIKVKKNYGYARVEKIIKPSEFRVEAGCENAVRCGGCQLQHLSYEKQLEYKQNKVKNCLVRMGGIAESYIDAVMEPIMGMDNPYNYRNKAQFPVGMTKDGDVAIGFYAGRTHSIIDCDYCSIQNDISNDVMQIVRKWINKYGIEPYDECSHSGIVRHILTRVGYVTGEVMVCLVVTDKKVPYMAELVEMLKEIEGNISERNKELWSEAVEGYSEDETVEIFLKSVCLNINKEKTNKILGDKIVNIYGENYIEDYIGDVKYRISPLSFYQVNPVQTKKLYGTALEYAGLTGNEIVWDLYCGIGTISLFLAQKAKGVLGVEIVPQAIEDAKVNAAINGIDNTLFIAGAAEDVGDYLEREGHDIYAKPDVVVVDPPRKGCDEKLIDTILDIAPERIVYVSCDPATLARDVKLLGEGGYEVKRVRACDMFGMTVHCETCVLLTHKDITG